MDKRLCILFAILTQLHSCSTQMASAFIQGQGIDNVSPAFGGSSMGTGSRARQVPWAAGASRISLQSIPQSQRTPIHVPSTAVEMNNLNNHNNNAAILQALKSLQQHIQDFQQPQGLPTIQPAASIHQSSNVVPMPTYQQMDSAQVPQQVPQSHTRFQLRNNGGVTTEPFLGMIPRMGRIDNQFAMLMSGLSPVSNLMYRMNPMASVMGGMPPIAPVMSGLQSPMGNMGMGMGMPFMSYDTMEDIFFDPDYPDPMRVVPFAQPVAGVAAAGALSTVATPQLRQTNDIGLNSVLTPISSGSPMSLDPGTPVGQAAVTMAPVTGADLSIISSALQAALSRIQNGNTHQGVLG